MHEEKSSKTNIFKRTLKIILWIISVIFISAFIIIAGIRLPFFQKIIISKVTSYYHNKTGSNIRLNNIYIRFLSGLELKGLYVEDSKADTLLYADNIQVGINYFSLIKGHIKLGDISISELNATIIRSAKDSSFNFDFIVKAFASADTTAKDPNSKPVRLSVNEIQLSDINLNYLDSISGISLKTHIGSLEVPVEKMNLSELEFNVGKIKIESSDLVMVQLFNVAKVQSNDTTAYPKISIEAIALNQVHFLMTNVEDSTSFEINSGEADITPKFIAIADNHFDFNKIELAGSSISVVDEKISKSETKTQQAESKKFELNLPFRFLIDQLALDNCKVHLASGTKETNGFDSNHLFLEIHNIKGRELFCGGSKIGATIVEASVSEASGAELKSLNASFQLTPTKAFAQIKSLEFNNTAVFGNLAISYASLDEMVHRPGNTFVESDLNVTGKVLKDLIFFQPKLLQNPMLSRNQLQNLNFHTKVYGKVDDLKIEPTKLTVNSHTSLNLNGWIKNVTDFSKASFNINLVQLNSTAAGLGQMVELPTSIRIPERMAMSGNCKGTVSDFSFNIITGTNRGRFNSRGTIQFPHNDEPHFTVSLVANDLDVGYVMKNDTLYGLTNLNLEANGVSFKPEFMHTKFKLSSDRITYNKYAYSNLNFDGAIVRGTYIINGGIRDTNLQVDINAEASLSKGLESGKASINLKGSDFQALHFSDSSLKASGEVKFNFSSFQPQNLNGSVDIKNVWIIKNEKTYKIPTLAFISLNEKRRSRISMKSSLLDAEFNGTLSIVDIKDELNRFTSRYFSAKTDSTDFSVSEVQQKFDFSIIINDPATISELFVPGLNSFQAGEIKGSYDSYTSVLTFNAEFPFINYQNSEIDSLKINVISDKEKITASVRSSAIKTDKVMIPVTSINSIIQNNFITTTLNITDDSKKRIHATAEVQLFENSYKIKFPENNIILNDKKWMIPAAAVIELNKQTKQFTDFSITEGTQSIAVANSEVDNKSAWEIKFKDFQIGSLTQLMEKDTILAEGKVNGLFTLIPENGGMAFTSDLNIDSLEFLNHPVGDMTIKASSANNKSYIVKSSLSGNENDFNIEGVYRADSSGGNLAAHLVIKSLQLKTIEPFTNNAIAGSKGYLSGDLKIDGPVSSPQMDGYLKFNKAGTRVQYLNNYLSLNDAAIKIDAKGVYFDQLNLTDSLGRTAAINGSIDIVSSKEYNFNVDINADKFLLLNSIAKNNDVFFGTVFTSSRVKIRGNNYLPRIEANIKVLDDSRVTFIVPEKNERVDVGEKDVRFTDPYHRLNTIMTREAPADTFHTNIKGIELVSNFEITKNSTLTILVDQQSGDSLIVKGDATMSFTMDPSGKTSLTGGFEIAEGSYQVSLQNLVKKRFAISRGSYINWKGDVTDAEIKIEAVNVVNTPPLELVADQVAGLSESELNAYRQRLPFQIILHMEGVLMKPIIRFEITLPPEDQDALNGTVYAKLNLLNRDESELNKQVFALLVLNRFIQQDPLENQSGSGFENVARNSVGKFLSQQLNVFAEQYVKGVELNFDVQSYDDYSNGQSEGRTEVNLGVTKKFLGDRLIVQVAGNVDVEGERASQNNVSNLAGDIVLEYLLTEDGRYRVKVFRKDQYAGVLDGEIKEAGLGLLYTRDFDKWSEFVKKPKKVEDGN